MSGRRKRPVVPGPPGNAKVARAEPKVSSPRRPRYLPSPDIANDLIVVRFNRVDVDSRWCLSTITTEDHRQLLGRLRGIESMTLHAVFSTDGRIGKDYQLDKGLPNKDANKRLEELGLDDLDFISRLRITGERRLYGIREANQFYALWWDPHHEIWP